MTGLLTEDDPGKLRPANAVMIPSPMPTQVVASDEVWPSPRTGRQKRAEARIKEMADGIGWERGIKRRRVLETAAGTRRALSDGILTPIEPRWLDEVERCLTQLDVDSREGDTAGDNTSKHLARHPWRMDDERLLHPFRERGARAGEGRGNLAYGHVIGEPEGATIMS